jgi:hypothetical protein
MTRSKSFRYVSGVLYLVATVLFLGACKNPPTPPPGQALTFQQKYAHDSDASYWQVHCCRRGSSNGKHN